MRGAPIKFQYIPKIKNKNVEKFAGTFKALSNPNRLRLFMRLITCCKPGMVTRISADTASEGRACAGGLGKDLNIVASKISHHMKELRQAGLVPMERRGQRIERWIEPEALASLQGFFS
jgi:ArsR family transcriptional regulator